ncbi:MAG: flagellar hook-associated protein FlgL [Bacillota bacterium]
MRITNKLITNNVTLNIQKNLSKSARTQEQLATGKSMLRPSDKPENLSQVLGIKAHLSYMDQYEKNIDDGLGYLNLTDSSMQTLGNILHDASEKAVQGANDTYNAEDRKSIAEQIDKLIDHALDLANSSMGGRYIYAGTKNSRAPFERIGDRIVYKGDFNGLYREVLSGDDYRIDSPGVTRGYSVDALLSSTGVLADVTQRPNNLSNTGIITITRTGANTFSITDQTQLDGVTPNNNLIASHSVDVTGNIITVNGASDLLGMEIDMTGTNVGDSYRIRVESKLGVYGNATETAVPGEYDVYNPALVPPPKDPLNEGIFDTLFRLRDNLLNNDRDAIDLSVDEIKNKTDELLERRVGIGARTRHFEAVRDQMKDIETKLKESLDLLEGADMYKLSIDMSQDQVTFQASLASGANIMKVSLLDFLR